MIRDPHVGNARVRAVASRLYAVGTMLEANARSLHAHCSGDTCRTARAVDIFDHLARYIDDDTTGDLALADSLLRKEGVVIADLREDGD